MGRPETGVMCFGDDWPGIFIRGDDCLLYHEALSVINHGSSIQTAVLKGLQDLLESAYNAEKRYGEIQKMPSFNVCLQEPVEEE